MKYIIVLASGLADEASADLDGHTPLEVARAPTLNEMALRGKLGLVTTLPEALPACEAVGLLSALGYDPHTYFAGEASLPAAALVSQFPEGYTAFVHNLVTAADGFIRDHAAGHILPPEAGKLLDSLGDALDDDGVQFMVGAGFTGITLVKLPVGPLPKCLPPEALWNRPVRKALPKGKAAAPVRRIINLSEEIFLEHEINRVRTDLGENPANLLWLWGAGRPRELPSFRSLHNLDAAMITVSESARGLGKLAEITVLDCPRAQSGYDLDGHAAAQAAVDALARYDVVIVHTFGAAEAALEGDAQRKVGVIHEFDDKLLSPLFRYANENEFVRVLVLPTHTASTAQRARLHTPVPAVMFGSGLEPVRGNAFTESNAQQGEVVITRGHELLAYFLRD